MKKIKRSRRFFINLSVYLLHFETTYCTFKNSYLEKMIRKDREEGPLTKKPCLHKEIHPKLEIDTQPPNTGYPVSLQQHLRKQISLGLEANPSWPILSEKILSINDLVERFFQELQLLVGAVDNRQISQTGTQFNRALTKCSSDRLLSLINREIPIQFLLQEYENYLQENKQIFDQIQSRHKLVNDTEWNIISKHEDSLVSYADAAHAMGTKIWVAECNRWMADYCYQYFKKQGALRYYHKQNRNQTQPLKKELNSSFDRMIQILDVGSCYNPLTKYSDLSPSFDLTAIDLCPAEEALDVLKCDFLTVDIGSEGSSIELSPDEPPCVLRLPAKKYDVVTMSLVLNYLGTPDAREQMVKKARLLLKSPQDYSKDSPYHGLLLIVEKQSILINNLNANPKRSKEDDSASKYTIESWKKSMSDLGFDYVTYQYLTTSDDRKSHVFVFATSKINLIHEQPNYLSDYQPTTRLHIKQDFTNTIASL